MGLADITTSLHTTGLGAFSTGNLSFSEKMPQGWSLFHAILPTTTTRAPFTSGALKEIIPILLILYSLAVLVQLPNTKTARLSLLPIIISLSYRVITKYDTAAPFDDPGYTYHNLAFICFTIFLCLRAIDFGTADKPWQRTIWSWRPKAAPDGFVTQLKYAMLDAFDLTMNNRGIGWSWGKGVYDPPLSARYSAPRTALASFPFFISFVKAMVLFDFTLLAQQSWTLHPSAYPTHPIGGTIFDPTLPPHLRIGKVILMTFLCALGLCTSFQMSYYGLAFAMIALGGQQPEQWPPMFDEPWRATSLADFWGKRWHQMFKRAFVVAGGKPFGRYFGRPGGVIGSFLVSGLMHDFGVWGLGLGMDLSGVTLFFVMMGVGCVLEGLWEQKVLKGKKVQGPLGWVWAMIWMFAWGSLIVDAWARRGLIESKMLPDGARPAVWWAQTQHELRVSISGNLLRCYRHLIVRCPRPLPDKYNATFVIPRSDHFSLMELDAQCSMVRHITNHTSASSTNTYCCQSASYKPPGYQGLITINSQLVLEMLSILTQLSLGALASFVLWWIYRRVNTVSVSDIPGPKSESLWLGNLRQLLREEVGETDHQWRRAFGNVVRFKAPFGEDRLWISDPKTIQYILNTSRYHFVKPYDARFLLNAATGNGIIGAEGEGHVRMRRVLSPAFGIKECKALVPLFRESVLALIEQLEDLIAQNPDGSYVANIPTVVGRANLDALGKAAFEYDFGSLRGKSTELEESLHQFTTKGYGLPSNWKLFMQGIMAHASPRLLNMMTYFPSESLEFLQRHVRLSNDISKTLLSKKQDAFEEGNLGKDVLSLVVKANLSETEKHRLEDEEVIPQLSSILSAGYETSTNSIGWIIFELARHPEKHRTLCDEVIRAQEAAEAQGQIELSYEEIANLPYLNAVIKETYRFDTVVPHLFRQATRDDVLPLSKTIRTSSRKIVDSIPIPKGIRIVISNVGYNQDETIWGHDAGTWRPERWLDGTVENSVWNRNQALDGDTNVNIGVMNNLMSFGSGHRGCIGWRFALVETQIFLFEMIRKLNFEVTEDIKEGRVRRENCLVTQPLVEGKEVGSLPIRISAAQSFHQRI